MKKKNKGKESFGEGNDAFEMYKQLRERINNFYNLSTTLNACQ